MRKNIRQNGSAIIFALLLMGIMLLISTTLAAVFIPKINLAVKAKNSVGAIYAAESGVEWCLYVARISPSAVAPTMANGAIYTNNSETALLPSNCVSPLRVIGSYQGVSRAIEVNF